MKFAWPITTAEATTSRPVTATPTPARQSQVTGQPGPFSRQPHAHVADQRRAR